MSLGELLDDLETELLVADRGNTPSVAVVELAPSQLMNVSTASRASGVPARTLRHRCITGRYPGAQQVGGIWLIPANEIAKEIP